MKWEKRDQALQHFQQAYLIYDVYFRRKHNSSSSVQAADAAMQVANIMEEQNRLNDAKKYVDVAVETYSNVYGINSDNTIIATWLKL